MTTIYLIRHAEAEGNVCRRAHGQYDSLVTPNGGRQLAALADRFRDIPLDAVYASDLYRTRHTAAAVANTQGLPVQPFPPLREIKMGVWEDRAWGELEHRWPELLHQFNHQPDIWAVEGSETFEQLRVRLHEAVRELVRRNPGRTIAAASHGMAMRALLSALLGLTCAEMKDIPHSDNTAVTVLRAEDPDHIRVETIGDTSHLSGDLSTFATQHWWKEGGARILDRNLWFRPMDPADPFVGDCRRAAWQAAHGDLDYYNEGLPGEPDAAHQTWAAMLCDEPVGLLELALTARAGEITFMYLRPDCQGDHLGRQLLGQAVSVCRAAGLGTLTLRCPVCHEDALRFFRRWDFKKTGYLPGADVRVPVLCMERSISVPGIGEN